MKNTKRRQIKRRPESTHPVRASIIVKPSGIHGRGVFAARNIPADEVIIAWSKCSQKLTGHQLKTLSATQRKRVSYIGGENILFKPPACYVNHSCDANARGADGRDMAVRPIKKGEEITVDYVREKVPGLRLQCHCGSPNCRGTLMLPTPKRTPGSQ